MSEIKNEIKQNADGSFTITDAHSTADIVRWLLTQDSKETILYLLKEESPQPEQEPVGEIGWAANIPNTIREVNWTELCPPVGTKLYTTPPQRTWVGLTEKEIRDFVIYPMNPTSDLVRLVEMRLKEKNFD